MKTCASIVQEKRFWFPCTQLYIYMYTLVDQSHIKKIITVLGHLKINITQLNITHCLLLLLFKDIDIDI